MHRRHVPVDAGASPSMLGRLRRYWGVPVAYDDMEARLIGPAKLGNIVVQHKMSREMFDDFQTLLKQILGRICHKTWWPN